MIFAQNPDTGEIVLEAFDAGIPVPFLISPSGAWQPAAVSVDSLHQDFVDASGNVAARDLYLSTAHDVVTHIANLIERSEFDHLSIREIRELLIEKSGRNEVDMAIPQLATPVEPLAMKPMPGGAFSMFDELADSEFASDQNLRGGRIDRPGWWRR